MSAFTDRDPDWAALLEGTTYIVRVPLVWSVGRKGRETVTVPAGERFDFSVPVWLRWAANPHNPRYLGAACLHDHLLRDGWQVGQAGGVFNDALIADGVGRFRAALMTLAVILFATQPD